MNQLGGRKKGNGQGREKEGEQEGGKDGEKDSRDQAHLGGDRWTEHWGSLKPYLLEGRKFTCIEN